MHTLLRTTMHLLHEVCYCYYSPSSVPDPGQGGHVSRPLTARTVASNNLRSYFFSFIIHSSSCPQQTLHPCWMLSE